MRVMRLESSYQADVGLAGLGQLKFVAVSADLSRKSYFSQIGGTIPMTKIDAFRQAVAEIGDATPEEMAAFIQRKFGIVIEPQYVPLFRATLHFHKSGAGPEKSNEPACLLEAAS